MDKEIEKPSTDREAVELILLSYRAAIIKNEPYNLKDFVNQICSLMEPKVLRDDELGNIAIDIAVRDEWCIRGEDITGWMPAFKAISQATVDKALERTKEE